MGRVNHLKAYETIMLDDLKDVVSLVARLGYDKRSFFENHTFSNLDLRNSDLRGVSFKNSRLRELTVYDFQYEMIGDTSPNEMIDFTVLVSERRTSSIDAYRKAVQLVDKFPPYDTKLDFSICGPHLNRIPPNLGSKKRISSIGVSGSKIVSLTEISRLENLEELNASRSSISDISCLSRLEKLTHLFLSKTLVSSIEGISKLTQLKWLSLDGTNVSDVAPLATARGLIEIHLHDTLVRDVSCLSELTNLKWLTLPSKHTVDLGKLRGNKKIKISYK